MRQVLTIAVIVSGSCLAGCNDASVPQPATPPSVPVIESPPVVDSSPTADSFLEAPHHEAASIQTAFSGNSDPAFTDQKIALSFPRSVGRLSFVDHHPYAQTGLGYSVRYENEDVMKVDIYVYDMGRTDISSGHTGEDIIAELENAEADIRYYEEQGAYRDVEKLGGGVYPSSVTESDVAFQFSRHQYRQSARPGVVFTGLRASETYIRGFKEHFIKVRVTYPQESAEESIEARDQFLQRLAELIASS